jgi:fermentation-respiration switch protein FrsA (DUF1100 family)
MNLSCRRRMAVYFLAVPLALYLAICLFMFLAQRSLIFRPDKIPLDPAYYGLPHAEKLRIPTEDGETLTAWHIPPTSASAPTVFYLHGNAGSLGDRIKRFAALSRAGWGVFALSYRGYGDSTGAPTENGLFLDAEAGRRYLEEELGAGPESVVLYGESLGTGVAARLAGEGYRPRFLALDAPYASILAVGRESYPWLPVSLLLTDKFDTLSRIGKVAAPLLVIHGTADAVIPFAQGKSVFDAARGEKRLFTIEKGGHVDLPADKLVALLREFDQTAK